MKNKKYKLLLPISLTLLSIPLFSISCSINREIESSVLSSFIVNENFNSIWKGKSFITSEDLSPYREIRFDAFDDIKQDLEYVDISNIKLYDSNISIKWPKVKEIRTNNSIDKKIVNDLLFVKSLTTWKVNSLANRNKNIDLLIFPTVDQVDSDSNLKYSISDNFYDFTLFQNVKKITFNNDNEETPIYSFGSESFKDCDKLVDNLILNFKISTMVYFDSNSFSNINSEKVSINFQQVEGVNSKNSNPSFKSIFLDNNSFSNNKNLISFSINDPTEKMNTKIWLEENILSNCKNLNSVKFKSKVIEVVKNILTNSTPLFTNSNNLSNIEFNAEIAIFNTNKIFSNNYKQLNLFLLITKGIQLTQQTFVGMIVPNDKLRIKTYDKSFLYPADFSSEQWLRIEEITNNS